MNTFDDRSQTILKYNVAGIVMNLLLGLAKVVVGSIIRAHAIIIDGANSFTVDFKEKDLSFYVVENYDIKNREDCYRRLYDEVQKQFPDMHIDIYQGIDM